jgi:hypothetical protein
LRPHKKFQEVIQTSCVVEIWQFLFTLWREMQTGWQSSTIQPAIILV